MDSEGDARNTLARALISQGNLSDAQMELDSAGKIGVQDFATKISLAITDARLKARTGKSDEARQELDSQLAAAGIKIWWDYNSRSGWPRPKSKPLPM